MLYDVATGKEQRSATGGGVDEQSARKQRLRSRFQFVSVSGSEKYIIHQQIELLEKRIED